MDYTLSQVVQAHHSGFVVAALIVCAIGAVLTVMLLAQSKGPQRRRMRAHTSLAALIAGTTVWATHFIAMLGYNPAGQLAYDPIITVLSFITSVVGCVVTMVIAGIRRLKWRSVFAGIIFGLTVSGMHYLGMAALEVPGRFDWHPGFVIVSVLLGCLFGVIMVHRILYPVKNHNWIRSTVAMMLAIGGVHFVGMGATIFTPDPSVIVPDRLISNFVLGFMVFAVIGLIFLVGITAFAIEVEMAADTKRRLDDAERHDALTNLPNRLGFVEHATWLQRRIDRGEEFGVAVMIIDVAFFKHINDSMGHATGDAVLRHVADQLKSVIGPNEYVARIGGDEFAAFKYKLTNRTDAYDFALRIKEATSLPLHSGVIDLKIGVCIGIATLPEDGTDIEVLLHRADLAMYQCKSINETKITFYDDEIERVQREKQALQNDLSCAIAKGELFLNYQFQNNLVTHDVNGFEVLLRWLHPEKGLIGPAVFIPLAEESGLIKDIGMWVLETACYEAATWDLPYPIAVNVSPQQLIEPDFVTRVAGILADCGLPPARLEVEITEATIIQDQRNALAVMHQLKAMGIRIAMDDFGTGYSSLSTLQAFPFDKIKIDRSFVHNVHQSRQNAAIVRATLLLGVALDVPVLAEGAETKAEIAFLSQESCDAVQGYYFGKPMSVHDVRLTTMRCSHLAG